MKAFTVTAILVVLTAIAVAKPVPVKNLNPMEDLNPAFARVDVDINSGPAGAMLSANISRRPGLR
jgi:multisubunit Na+/H+ antiporter MnhE subunit